MCYKINFLYIYSIKKYFILKLIYFFLLPLRGRAMMMFECANIKNKIGVVGHIWRFYFQYIYFLVLIDKNN